MVPFPCSPDMTRLYDHTIHEHTLRSTRCPITISRSLQQEGWNTNQARPAPVGTIAFRELGVIPDAVRTNDATHKTGSSCFNPWSTPAAGPPCKGGGIYRERIALAGLLFHQLTKLYQRSL